MPARLARTPRRSGRNGRARFALAAVSGQRNLTERLTANLIDNAIRHNVPGGCVEVTTDTSAGQATIVVTNTGPVVPPGAVEDLFQPFRRLGGDRLSAAAGHGLGLSIVRAVADAHDATLDAATRPG